MFQIDIIKRIHINGLLHYYCFINDSMQAIYFILIYLKSRNHLIDFRPNSSQIVNGYNPQINRFHTNIFHEKKNQEFIS